MRKNSQLKPTSEPECDFFNAMGESRGNQWQVEPTRKLITQKTGIGAVNRRFSNSSNNDLWSHFEIEWIIVTNNSLNSIQQNFCPLSTQSRTVVFLFASSGPDTQDILTISIIIPLTFFIVYCLLLILNLVCLFCFFFAF